MSDIKELIFNKIKNGDKLTADEVRILVIEHEKDIIDEICICEDGWTESLNSIVKIENKYYSIHWTHALVGSRSNNFESQKAEEVKPSVKVFTTWPSV